MTPIRVEILGKHVWLRRGSRFVFHIDEAPDLVRQLQSLIRAHTIQTQNEDQPNA